MCSYGADVNKRSTSGDTALTLILRCAQKRALKLASGSDDLKTSASHSGKNFWVPVAHLLVRRGAEWDPSFKDELGRTQLHMLFSGPAPPQKDLESLAYLAESALNAGLNAFSPDKNGQTAAELALKNGQNADFEEVLRQFSREEVDSVTES
jgi:ankyrin repeat protein